MYGNDIVNGLPLLLSRMKIEEVSLRLPLDTKRAVQQGASPEGQKLREFMVASSTERAREILEQQRVITMSQTAFDTFVSSLKDPEIRPATPLAAKAITVKGPSLRREGPALSESQ